AAAAAAEVDGPQRPPGGGHGAAEGGQKEAVPSPIPEVPRLHVEQQVEGGGVVLVVAVGDGDGRDPDAVGRRPVVPVRRAAGRAKADLCHPTWLRSATGGRGPPRREARLDYG